MSDNIEQTALSTPNQPSNQKKLVVINDNESIANLPTEELKSLNALYQDKFSSGLKHLTAGTYEFDNLTFDIRQEVALYSTNHRQQRRAIYHPTKDNKSPNGANGYVLKSSFVHRVSDVDSKGSIKVASKAVKYFKENISSNRLLQETKKTKKMHGFEAFNFTLTINASPSNIDDEITSWKTSNLPDSILLIYNPNFFTWHAHLIKNESKELESVSIDLATELGKELALLVDKTKELGQEDKIKQNIENLYVKPLYLILLFEK